MEKLLTSYPVTKKLIETIKLEVTTGENDS